MSLPILIVIATISYALYDIFASRASNAIDPNLSSVIFNGLGMLIPLGIYAFYKFVKGAKFIGTTGAGVTYSVLAGVAIAVFSIFLIKIFEKGGLSYVVPLIYGGAIALTALVGWAVYKESVSLSQTIGIIIILAGVAVVVISKLNSPSVS
ncbi:MAG: EamA family transporter [Patescibacteria group bacterium]|nr:EamA family transporter [Patescibacteria group bacterium]MCL5262034.1 EamA family transporter [Patescibacteria group bacterium]